MRSSCQTREHDTQPCDHCWLQAKAMSVTYLLNNDKFTSKDAMEWEKDVFIDTLTHFNSLSAGDDGAYKYLSGFYNDSIWPLPSKDKLLPVFFYNRWTVFDSIRLCSCQRDQFQTN
jgi:Niemann-Pick C1 protein